MTAIQTIERQGSTITIHNVQDRPRRRRGQTFAGPINEGQHVELVPGSYIRLFGAWESTHGREAHDITFRVGDLAEYDSYNYQYVGIITAIGAKTVTIEHQEGSRPARRKLSLYEFSWRNKRFNAEAIAAANEITNRHV